MSDTPDLSKIVNMIMSNPELINEIKSMAEEKSEEPLADAQPTIPESTAPVSQSLSKSEKRARLLSGLRPYLREDRQKTLDTMLTFANMLEAVRGK